MRGGRREGEEEGLRRRGRDGGGAEEGEEGKEARKRRRRGEGVGVEEEIFCHENAVCCLVLPIG